MLTAYSIKPSEEMLNKIREFATISGLDKIQVGEVKCYLGNEQRTILNCGLILANVAEPEPNGDEFFFG